MKSLASNKAKFRARGLSKNKWWRNKRFLLCYKKDEYGVRGWRKRNWNGEATKDFLLNMEEVWRDMAIHEQRSRAGRSAHCCLSSVDPSHA